MQVAQNSRVDAEGRLAEHRTAQDQRRLSERRRAHEEEARRHASMQAYMALRDVFVTEQHEDI